MDLILHQGNSWTCTGIWKYRHGPMRNGMNGMKTVLAVKELTDGSPGKDKLKRKDIIAEINGVELPAVRFTLLPAALGALQPAGICPGAGCGTL